MASREADGTSLPQSGRYVGPSHVYYTLGPPVFWCFCPVPISKDDVDRVAHLARIGIDSTEIDTYTADLDRILNLVEQMNEISTQGIEPLAHPQDMQLRLRGDAVTENDQRTLFQSIAPQTDQGHYLVPKVID